MTDPVAKVDIYVSAGVCAHRAGSPVPAANVKRNGWEDLVEAAPKAETRSDADKK